MAEQSSPVQPLDSGGSSDPRLANMLATAPQQTETAREERAIDKVAAHLCPNCKNSRGVEVELEDGKCNECGFDASRRPF